MRGMMHEVEGDRGVYIGSKGEREREESNEALGAGGRLTLARRPT